MHVVIKKQAVAEMTIGQKELDTIVEAADPLELVWLVLKIEELLKPDDCRKIREFTTGHNGIPPTEACRIRNLCKRILGEAEDLLPVYEPETASEADIAEEDQGD